MGVSALKLVLGVELIIVDENHFSCRFCLVARKDDSLTITHTKLIEGNLPAVIAAIPKKQAIALSLSGKGIIHKNVENVNELDENQLFHQAFPSIEAKDFYVQYLNEGQNAVISVIRKGTVDELLDKLKRAGLNIYMLSLGGLAITQIWPQLNVYDTTVLIDHHSFDLDHNKQLLKYSYGKVRQSKFELKVGQEVIPDEHIVGYATAFQLILHDRLSTVKIKEISINDDWGAYITNEKLKQRSLIFLCALFGLLLLNFLLFSHYNQENAKLSEQLGTQTANSDQMETMKRNVATNERLLKQLNWNAGYNYGFVLNEIGESSPKQLQFLALTMNEYKTEQEKLERSPQINIIGSTANLTAVNNWVFVLKEKSWVKSVRLLKYQEDQETGIYQFNLMITY